MIKACKYLNVNVQNPGREVEGGEERGREIFLLQRRRQS